MSNKIIFRTLADNSLPVTVAEVPISDQIKIPEILSSGADILLNDANRNKIFEWLEESPAGEMMGTAVLALKALLVYVRTEEFYYIKLERDAIDRTMLLVYNPVTGEVLEKQISAIEFIYRVSEQVWKYDPFSGAARGIVDIVNDPYGQIQMRTKRMETYGFAYTLPSYFGTGVPSELVFKRKLTPEDIMAYLLDTQTNYSGTFNDLANELGKEAD